MMVYTFAIKMSIDTRSWLSEIIIYYVVIMVFGMCYSVLWFWSSCVKLIMDEEEKLKLEENLVVFKSWRLA